MDHVAIMNKKWRLIDKILTGEKKIESRWYMAKYPPWDRIKAGETVYFKDAGEPVTAKATVEKVQQYADCTESDIKRLVDTYGGKGNIAFVGDGFEWARKKKYCILIFLAEPQKVAPFDIDKKGFGNACAWLCIEKIEKIYKSTNKQASL